MSEFPNPCAAGGVVADSRHAEDACPCCGRLVAIVAGRWTDHSRADAVWLTGFNFCACGCQQEITEAFPTPIGWFQVGHEPTDAELDAELRAADGAAAGDRWERDSAA